MAKNRTSRAMTKKLGNAVYKDAVKLHVGRVGRGLVQIGPCTRPSSRLLDSSLVVIRRFHSSFLFTEVCTSRYIQQRYFR